MRERAELKAEIKLKPLKDTANQQRLPSTFLRPRHLQPDITYDYLRKLREAGSIQVKRFCPGGHGFYLASEFGLSIDQPITRQPDEVPYPALLRLRDIRNRIGLCRDAVERSVTARVIKPFLKHNRAKALYPTWQWQLLGFTGSNSVIQPEPAAQWLRRRIATKWLGVTAAELESWVRLGRIHRVLGCYDKNEIKRKILGMSAVAIKRIKNAEVASKLGM